MSDLLASPPPLDNLALIHSTFENRIHQHRHLPTNCSAYLTYQHDHQNPLLLPNKIKSYFYNRSVLTCKLKPSLALPPRSILYTNNTNLTAPLFKRARTTNIFFQYSKTNSSNVPEIKIISFRKHLSKEFLWDRAKQRLAENRARTQRKGDDLLFPVNMNLKFGREGSSKPFTPDTIARDAAGGRPKPGCQAWDEAFMVQFTKHNRLQDVTLARNCNVDHFFPLGASLLDFVANDARRGKWRMSKEGGDLVFPDVFSHFLKTRGLSDPILAQIEAKEIIVGETTGDTLTSTIEWARDNLACNLTASGIDLTSMDCEEVSIPKDMYRDILRAKPGDTFVFPTVPKKGVKCSQLPAKVMLGDGMGWILLISTLAVPMGNGRTKLVVPTIQPEVLSFLEEIPRVTGVGIESDVMEVEDLFSAWAGKKFRMKGFISLPAIAVLAGWNLPLVNMTTLSTQVLGGILNKVVSRGDHHWGISWRELPECMRVYCIGDIKFGYQAMLVLFHSIRQDLFPDPDIVLSFTRVDSGTFIPRLNEMLIDLLVGIVVENADLAKADCRKELCHALRTWSYNGKKSSHPPDRIAALAECFGDWPSLPNGGCRYLHQARQFFLVQCDRLKRVPGWSANIMPYEVDQEMREAATFTMPGLDSVDFAQPAATNHGFDLLVHPDLTKHTLQHVTNPKRLTSRVLLAHCKERGRVAREVFYEWVRVSLDAETTGSDWVVRVFHLVKSDRHYWRYLRTYYNETRHIIMRAMGGAVPRDPDCDARNVETARKAEEREDEHIERLKAQLKQRITRKAFLANCRLDSDSAIWNLTWRKQVPAYTSRTAIKRSRLEFAPGEAIAHDEETGNEVEVAQLRDDFEDHTEGRHRSKRAKRDAVAVTSRIMTQDEFEETIGRPPPVPPFLPSPVPAAVLPLDEEMELLLDAPDSEDLALETVASNSPGLLDRPDSPLD